MNELPSRNLALELVRVTEAAALAAGRFMGQGDKHAADQAAVDAMRLILNTIEMDALVASHDVFFAATGITDGELLDGVKYFGTGAKTDSLVVRGLTGAVRETISTHRWESLYEISPIKY